MYDIVLYGEVCVGNWGVLWVYYVYCEVLEVGYEVNGCVFVWLVVYFGG